MPGHGVPCWVWRSCILMSSMWLVIHCDFSLHSINWALSWVHRSTCGKEQTTGHHTRSYCTSHWKDGHCETNKKNIVSHAQQEAVMWLTSLWSCACSTCFWLSNSSSSSLRAFCNLRSSICKACCSLDGLVKSERSIIRVRTLSKSAFFRPFYCLFRWKSYLKNHLVIHWSCSDLGFHFDVIQFMIFSLMDLISMKVQHTWLSTMLLPFVSDEERCPLLPCPFLKQEEYRILQRERGVKFWLSAVGKGSPAFLLTVRSSPPHFTSHPHSLTSPFIESCL